MATAVILLLFFRLLCCLFVYHYHYLYSHRWYLPPFGQQTTVAETPLGTHPLTSPTPFPPISSTPTGEWDCESNPRYTFVKITSKNVVKTSLTSLNWHHWRPVTSQLGVDWWCLWHWWHIDLGTDWWGRVLCVAVSWIVLLPVTRVLEQSIQKLGNNDNVRHDDINYSNERADGSRK